MKFCCWLTLLVLLPTVATTPLKSRITFLVVFGDSWADNGINFATGDLDGFQSYSNGRVFSDYLSIRMRIPQHNYAYGGALSGYGNFNFDDPWSGLSWQVDKAIKKKSISRENTLVFYGSGGNNDLVKDFDSFEDIIPNNYRNVKALLDNGFSNILLADLGDFSDIPYFRTESGKPFKEPYRKAIENLNGNFVEQVYEPLRKEYANATIVLLKMNPMLSNAIKASPNITTEYERSNGQKPNDRLNYAFFDKYHMNSGQHFRLSKEIFKVIKKQFQ